MRFLSYVQVEGLRRQVEAGVGGPESMRVRHPEGAGAQSPEPERAARETGRAMGGWPGTQRELGRGVARRRQAKLEEASGEQEGAVRPVEGHREAGTMKGVTGFGGLAVTGGRGVLS